MFVSNHHIIFTLGNVSVGFINPWTGEEIPSSISDHDEDSLHGKFLIFVFPLTATTV